MRLIHTLFALAVLSVGSVKCQLMTNPTGCIDPSSFDPTIDYFPEKVQPVASRFWTIEYFNSYKILRNTNVGESYLLYQCGTPPPASEEGRHLETIAVPLQDGVATDSTTLIPHFEILGLRSQIRSLIRFASFTSSPCLLQRLADGNLTLVESVDDPANLNALRDQFGANIVNFHNSRTGYTSSLMNVTVSEFSETTNAGTFEWNKYISAFFNAEALSNQIFETTTERYTCVTQNSALVVTEDGGRRPTVLWATYTNFSGADGWDLARCPNFYCEYATRCTSNIIISDDEGTIDFFGSKLYTTQDFVRLAQNADHWIYPSGNWDEAFNAYGDVLSTFTSVQNQQVFDNQGSGNGWFDQRLVEYDIVLEDFCQVVGTDNVNDDHQRVWLRNVFTEQSGNLGECTDVNAPLQTQANDCTPRLTVLPLSSICFAGETTVNVLGYDNPVALEDLEIGQRVLTAKGDYKQVYGFGHYEPDIETEYFALVTDKNTLPLHVSGDHLVFSEKQGIRRAVPASTLVVGDKLVSANGNLVVITAIYLTQKAGRFAPFTESGTIIVNGVAASSFVSLQKDSPFIVLAGVQTPISWHAAAQAFLAPHRLACKLGLCGEHYTKTGISKWVYKPLQFAKWWIDQDAALAWGLGFFMLLIVGSFVIVEAMFLAAWPLLCILGAALLIATKIGATNNKREKVKMR